MKEIIMNKNKKWDLIVPQSFNNNSKLNKKHNNNNQKNNNNNYMKIKFLKIKF